jgi:hypothetical protein
MRLPSRITIALGIVGFILLMWGRALTSPGPLVVATNGTRQTIMRSDHPQAFAMATVGCFLVGVLLIAGAVYAHFGLRLTRSPSNGPWGFSWFGIIPFAIALVLILIVCLIQFLHH